MTSSERTLPVGIVPHGHLRRETAGRPTLGSMPGPRNLAPLALERMPALDGLRGVAALLVVLTHAAFLTGFGTSAGLPGHLLARGDFGVALFFALSGFLLMRLLTKEAGTTGRLDLRRYAFRRFFRVLPAYWLTVLAIVLVTGPSTRDALLHLGGAQIYVADSSLRALGQSWSIATELSFYAFLPVVVVGLDRLRRRRPGAPILVLGSALVVTSLLGLTVGPTVLGEDVALERWLPWRAPHFLVGMLLAEAISSRGHPWAGSLRRWADDAGGCVAVAVAAYVASTTPVAGSLLLEPAHGLQLVLRTGLATVFAGGLLLPLVLGRSSAYSRALARPVVRWVGLVSFGLFLWHLPVFEGLYAVTGAPFFRGGIVPLLATGLPISLALAYLSYRLVEVPGSRIAARLARRRGRRQGDGESEKQDEPDGSFEPGGPRRTR